jgi:uncharacterized membrane protein (TIGR02234 family)
VPPVRREFTLTLVFGAAGGGLILLALRQVWARAVYTPPHPFPAQDLPAVGQKLVPLAYALAIAALACLAAVIATRGVLRRAAGVLLAVIGAGAAVAATVTVTAPAVLSAAVSVDPTAGQFASSTTSGTTSGGTTSGGTMSGGTATFVAGITTGHVVITGLAWHVAAVAGALAIVLAGVVTAWRGSRWPVMSARFDRPRPGKAGEVGGAGGAGYAGSAGSADSADSAGMWEALSRGLDPTEGSIPASAASAAPPSSAAPPASAESAISGTSVAPDEVDFGPGSG